MSPSFSVVIPAYNAERHIAATIASVTSQQFQPLEIVVVDDGSTDDTALVAMASSPLVRCHRQENSGAAAARNTGIRLACGTHVAFLDADDRWLPHHLANLRQALERYDVRWAASAYTVLFETYPPREIPRMVDGIKGDQPVLLEDYFQVCSRAWRVFTSACAMERTFLIEHEGFDTRLRIGEDLDLWFRLALAEPRLAYCPRPSVFYRQVEGSLMDQESDPFDGFYGVLCRMQEQSGAIGSEVERRTRPLRRRSADSAARVAGRNTNRAQARRLLAEFGSLLSPAVRLRLVMCLVLPTPLNRALWSLRSRG
ncbi:MAG: glycosyltransferase family A protein [bacterium]